MHHRDATQKYRTPGVEATPAGTLPVFFGEANSGSHYPERPAVLTVQALTQVVRGVSGVLVRLTPADWAAVRHTTSITQLLEVASEFDVTLVAITEEGLDHILQDFPDECGGA